MQLGLPLLDTVQDLDRRLVICIQTELTRIEASDLGLQCGERPGGLFGTFRSLPLCGGEPANLGRCCFATAAQRIDLSSQPGQPFAPIRSGTDERRQPIFFTALSVLAVSAVVSIGASLLIVAASPLVIVVGYETVGYRHQAAVLESEGV